MLQHFLFPARLTLFLTPSFTCTCVQLFYFLLLHFCVWVFWSGSDLSLFQWKKKREIVISFKAVYIIFLICAIIIIMPWCMLMIIIKIIKMFLMFFTPIEKGLHCRTLDGDSEIMSQTLHLLFLPRRSMSFILFIIISLYTNTTRQLWNLLKQQTSSSNAH